MAPSPLPPAFAAFVAPARVAPALWRLALGVVLAGAAWTGATLLLALAGAAAGAGPRAGLVLALLGFGGLMAGVWLAARLLHQRRPARLLGPGGFRWRQAAVAAAVVTAAGLVAWVPLALIVAPQRQLGVAEWAAWLPLAVPAILVQASAEELAFRGYLMPQLAARFRDPLVWGLGPALVFGLMHWDPAMPAWTTILPATASGLVLADVTVRTGNLSAAIGLHVANNLLALLVLAPATPLGHLGLWSWARSPGTEGWVAALDIATTLVAWGLWHVARGRLHSAHPGSI